jgi:hypothetical protein
MEIDRNADTYLLCLLGGWAARQCFDGGKQTHTTS